MGEDLKFRLGGLACLIGAVLLGWWGIWQPLQAARAHAPSVEYSSKIFALVPSLIVFGLFFLIGGTRWKYRDVERKRLTPLGWGLIAVVMILGFGCFFWLRAQFEALGYQ